jgi:uncharacterized protein
MTKKIIIAGGTGFIGRYLTDQFQQLGHQVIVISRQPEHVQWTHNSALINTLENSDLLINLAGKSINCRFTEKNKAALISSRTETTKILGNAVRSCTNPPKLWLNTSGANIYGYADRKAFTEVTETNGTDFLAELAQVWESAFFSFKLPQTRQIAMRISVVLGKNGGVLSPFLNLVRFGLGGKQGSGKQIFSWIHIADLYESILFFWANENINGAINITAPNPVDNNTLMHTIKRLKHIPIGLPASTWMIKIGARLIGTEPDLILKSVWVLPLRLEQAGYIFKYPNIESAISNLIELNKPGNISVGLI